MTDLFTKQPPDPTRMAASPVFRSTSPVDSRMNRLRIGAVSYLNTKPLVYGLEERLPSAELTFDLPSRLADRLSAGELDIALIPSVEHFRLVGSTIISNAAIACRGPVWSVRLLSRVAPSQIRTLALDEGSRTSAALVQILLWEKFGLRPRLSPLPIDQSPDAVGADATLLIGDRAMHPAVDRYEEIWDLGDQWYRLTESPFVFAMWVARPGLSVDNWVADAFESARDDGLAHIAPIARHEAGRCGLTVSDCVRYFSDNLHFALGAREQQGLSAFREKCAALQLIPPTATLKHPALSDPAS